CCPPSASAVTTWKCTDAAPTPIREGTSSVPSAFIPWQVAQLVMKIRSPSAASAWTSSSASAVCDSKTANSLPIPTIAMMVSITRAVRSFLFGACACPMCDSLGVLLLRDEENDDDHGDADRIDGVPVVRHCVHRRLWGLGE